MTLGGGADFCVGKNLGYLSTGARWDFRRGMALKAEVTWVEEHEPSPFFQIEPGGGFDGQTLLVQFALEWVF